MPRVSSLYRSSVGKKIVMALTGALLWGFVIVHMIGNLKVYFGAEKFDAYAKFLREFGYPLFAHEQFLWIARLVLLGAVGLHVLSALQLTRMSWQARPVGYKRSNDVSFSYASRTMRWGGVILAAFVLFHMLHLTTGDLHPGFSHESAYRNVVTAFSAWPVSVAYILCMIPLGLHMYHGLWSLTQTLALEPPWVRGWRRPVSAAIALIVVIGNVSIPLAVLLGVVR